MPPTNTARSASALRRQIHDASIGDQPFGFSTKFTDHEPGLVFYGKRYYDPSNGRFVGRDTIQERGGLHLYGFYGNNGVNRWGFRGLDH
ncbi:MAG: RHS repeat-associated core domain-containing protein [Opitutaceae bacterium]|nr:RHS repeat-associated core domain-containing protein [Opitutaceae bacterium]